MSFSFYIAIRIIFVFNLNPFVLSIFWSTHRYHKYSKFILKVGNNY